MNNEFIFEKHKRYLGLAWKTGGDFSSRKALPEKGRRAWNMRRSRCCGAPVHTCAPPLGNTFKISVSCRTSGARSGIQPRHVATKCGSGRRIKCGVTEGSAAGCSPPRARMTIEELVSSESPVVPGRAQRDPGIHWQRALQRQPLLDPRPRLRSGKDDGRGIGHAGNPREIAGCSRPCASMTMMREAQAEQYRALSEFNRSPGLTRGPFTPSTLRSIRQSFPVQARNTDSSSTVIPGRAQRDPGIQWQRALQRQPLLDPRPRLRSGKDDSEHTEAQGLCVIHANQKTKCTPPLSPSGLTRGSAQYSQMLASAREHDSQGRCVPHPSGSWEKRRKGLCLPEEKDWDLSTGRQ